MENESHLLSSPARMANTRDGAPADIIARDLNLSDAMTMEVSQAGIETELGKTKIPLDFICPLSKTLMVDPVIVASGQTFERRNIQEWLDQGNKSCPKTQQALEHFSLIPNYTVKALISNWCEAQNVQLPKARSYGQHSSARTDVGVADSRSFSSPTSQGTVESLDMDGKDAVAKKVSGAASKVEHNVQYNHEVPSKPFSRDDSECHRNLCWSQEESSRSIKSDEGVGLNSLEGYLSRSFTQEQSRSIGSTGLDLSTVSSLDDLLGLTAVKGDAMNSAQFWSDGSPYSSDFSRELKKVARSSSTTATGHDKPGSPASWHGRVYKRQNYSRHGGLSMPKSASLPVSNSFLEYNDLQQIINRLVTNLQSDLVEAQGKAAAELRLLSKYDAENRTIIAKAGAIRPLADLLHSKDPQTQEHAVTALLNLSINNEIKADIAAAGAIGPLVKVLKEGSSVAMENAAFALFSLSVMDENKVAISDAGAIPLLVNLLADGSLRGKKDAATALFSLSSIHENKTKIVRAGAVRQLVDLMADPLSGMVDKAVAILSCLATTQEGRVALAEEGGIPVLVEMIEVGSSRGKEFAASVLLHLCTNSNKHRALVLQEGAIPPLVALSQSGNSRAKEKASTLLCHLREQRNTSIGMRPTHERI